MGMNNIDEIEQLNQEIDLMLSSEDALEAALGGDNPLLHLAARLSTDSPPILSDAAKARIEGQVHAAKISSPNHFAWGGGLVALVAIIATVVFGGLFNNPEQDNSTIILTESDLSADVTEESFADTLTENDISNEDNSSDEIETEFASEITEIDETADPEIENLDTEATENIIIVQSEGSGTMFINAGGSANLRSEPNTSANIIMTLTPNTEVTVIGATTGGDWIQIVSPDGQHGWIARFLLSEQKGLEGDMTSPGGDGRDDVDDADCERGNSCNAPGQTGENENNGNSNGRGQDKDSR